MQEGARETGSRCYSRLECQSLSHSRRRVQESTRETVCVSLSGERVRESEKECRERKEKGPVREKERERECGILSEKESERGGQGENKGVV